jgi:hypothetical protein
MRRRAVIVVPADSHVSPELIDAAVAEAGRRAGGRPVRVEVMIPAVLPPTLPIGACPPRLAARLAALRDAARSALDARGMRGRAAIVPCRNVPALLHATGPAETLIVVGRAGWGVRRAAHGVASDLAFMTGTRSRTRRGAAPAAQPRPVAE